MQEEFGRAAERGKIHRAANKVLASENRIEVVSAAASIQMAPPLRHGCVVRSAVRRNDAPRHGPVPVS
jgi:hypothetical protein